MKHGWTAALVGVATALSAPAAEITRIATAAEDNTPFEMYLDVGGSRTQEQGAILRQWHLNGDLVNLPELRYTSQEYRVNVDAHIGLYHDLEFHYGVPYIVSAIESWGYAGATSAATSTIANNCLNADGTLTDPNCPTTGANASTIFGVPASNLRRGLGNMTFGLAWAPSNQKKDDTKPTWVVGFDWEAPTAAVINPSQVANSTTPGNVGDGVHKYKLWTAVSRKYGPAEPYFKVQYTMPFQGPGYYSNCKNISATDSAAPTNCFTGPWTYSETGIHEPMTGSMQFGTELYASEDQDTKSHVGFDFRGIVNAIGPGRYYDELSYVMGKLLSADAYYQLGGQFGFVAQPAETMSVKAYGSLLYNTAHSLTDESPGKDVTGSGSVNLSPGSPDINPNFDYRVDAPGRQFRLQDAFTFRLDVILTLRF